MRRTRLALLLVVGMVAALLPMGAVAPALAADDHLLLTEIVVTPTGGEFVEIHNPTGSAIQLSNYYLTDATYAGGSTYYYNIVTGTNAGGGSFGDFNSRFPDGSSIAPGEYQTISLTGSTAFDAEWGVAPTYELFEDDGAADAVPDMREATAGSINGQGGLTNSGEVVVIYTWDGAADLVTDVDYAVWGDKDEAVDKTGIAIDGPDADADTTEYEADTSIATQDIVAADAHANGQSWQRLDLTEGSEVGAGGNGTGGDDETSEDTSVTWSTAAATPGAGTAPPVVLNILINEVDADTDGTDVLEFVELFDGGSGTTALDGLVVVFYNGSSDLVYDAFDLDGFSTDAGGYFTLGNAGVVPTPSIIFASNGLQNGADAVALYAGDATDFPNDTALTTTDLVDAIVYDTDDADDAGLLVLLNAAQPQVDERGGGDGTAHSSQRCPDGTGGERNTETYAQYLPTPGAANTCAAPAIPVKIHEVQGSGPASPIVGQAVEVEGVVVGDFQGSSGLGGFFLQEEDADFDADPATSEGVFVYQGDTYDDVAVGDVVNVVGTVAESFDQTQIGSVTAVTVTSAGTGVASTATVSMPVASLEVWESHEGMLLTIPQTLYVSSVYALGRYGEVELAVGAPLDNPTNVVAPGAAANALQAANDLARIQLDDGSSWSNVDPTPYLAADGTLRNGDSTVYLTGVLGYGFGKYEIQPTSAVAFGRTNPRPAGSPAVGGTLTVASFNVLNYFTTIDTGAPICGPSGTLDCRGADTAEEFALQRTKIVNAIAKLDADVVGLMEIENHATDDALKDLVAGLNATMGAGTYDYVATGPVGDDAIKVALIFKPASVTPTGAFAVLDSSVDPTFLDEKNRPVVAQTFMEIGSGGSFTAAVNHLKSKGSDCDALGDPDTGDGQGNCNLTRTSAATAMVNWLQSDPTASGDDDVLIIGDLNSYAMEDPIAAVTGAGYSDLIATFEGVGVVSSAYSYEFGAQLGYLDHALSSSTLTSQVTGAAFWHINADEPTALDYQEWNLPANQKTDEFKSSDHDPVVIGLALDTVIVEPPDPVVDYFTDDDDSVFERDINAIAAVGITNGCNPPINDKYCPERMVTRGEFASLMARTRDLTVRSDNPFIDDDDSIFEADIEKIHAAGITTGCNPPLNDEYCEERTLTRGEAAAMFVRAFGYTDDGGGDLFIDDDDSVFEGDIDRLATAGVTLGCNPAEGNTKFCPNRSVTRGEVAAFIARALGI